MSDAQLLRYVHDELSESERARVEAEVAGTPGAAERLRVLQQRSLRLSALLTAVDPSEEDVLASVRGIQPALDGSVIPLQQVRHRTALLRAAAIATLLFGGLLLVEPARAWVGDQLRAAAGSLGLINVQAVPDPPEPPPAASDVRLSFEWASATFDISALTAAGTVVIRRGDVGVATAEIMGSPDGALTVMPGGIRIEGGGAPDAVYALTLPPNVEVRLRRGDTVTEHHVPDSGTLRLPLRP
ncbi:MAG TPA: hypothetical protein VK912_14290 [Longimicrobiales bacterium]|nr:hypothetical protein [Longimicrobiales bacterium]